MSFWGELKRRNVYKVGVAYVIVAWLIIEAVATIFPVLQLPEWTVTFVTALLILGFPVALILAWAFELTPDGIKLTKEVPRAESITHLTGQKLNYIVTALLVVAVAFLIIDNYYLDRRAIEQALAPTETEQSPVVAEVKEAPKTIAVLPFVNLSPDPDQEYFVDGLSEELLNSLTKIPDLLVTARTSSFSFKGTDKKVQEIAKELGVEHILEGSVRKADNALRITAQLIRAADGFHLWSETYDRELKDIFAVQEDVAKTVANELKLTLGIDKSVKQLGGTDNLEAYEFYLVAKGQRHNLEFTRALESIDRAIALDPEFALAWAEKVIVHLYLAELDAAFEAALRAIELEPSLSQAYLTLGSAHLARGEFIEAGLAFRKGMELRTESTLTDDFEDNLIVYYSIVGYLRKCHELVEEDRRNDPLDPTTRAIYMFNLGLLGDIQGAEKENEHGKAIFGDQWVLGDLIITLVRLGAKDVLSINEIPEIPEFGSIWAMGREHIESPEEGLTELRRIYTDNDNLGAREIVEISMFAAYFGDPEFALNAMERMNVGGLWFICIWSPVFQEVRELSRFKEFVREIGLVDFWKKFGWPDLCRPIGDDDFECD